MNATKNVNAYVIFFKLNLTGYPYGHLLLVL